MWSIQFHAFSMYIINVRARGTVGEGKECACMNEQQLKEWIYQNRQLQSACQNSDRDKSLQLIELALSYNPFMNYVQNQGGSISGLTRYGLDTQTENAIKEIDEIAQGLREYDY